MVENVDQLLRLTLKSGVVDRERLHAALQIMPLAGRDQPKTVADFLVKKRVLTPFQANKLLAGVAAGLKLGTYVIHAPIGKGGMGTVYLARDTRNDQPVAIKVVSEKRLKEGGPHLARFQREVVLSQKVKHPNIAATRDSGDVKGVHYLALEFIPGVTLYRLVTRDGPLAPDRAARLFVEVCDALVHAHSQGLIHRDLKPTNIMVTPDDHAKVLDLGLAMMHGEDVDDPEVVGGKGFLVGSIEYIAPEQTRDSAKVDARADLYSLGCTLYFTLTAKPPFPNGDTKDKIRAHRNVSPESIQSKNPAVPDGLAELIHRLLAKDPARRPQSAADVRRELVALGATPAPIGKSTDSAVLFELVADEPLDDANDTLSEIFSNDAAFDDGPALVNRDTARALFERDSQAKTIVWLILAAAAIGMLLLFFVIKMATMN